jgi:thioredoxin-like negative regulator of GroEL
MTSIQTQTAFEEFIQTHQVTLTYITGTNCGVCSSVKPKIQEILATRTWITAREINSHEHQALSAQLSIFTIPAVLVHVQGKETIREARYFSIQELTDKIDRIGQLLDLC